MIASNPKGYSYLFEVSRFPLLWASMPAAFLGQPLSEAATFTDDLRCGSLRSVITSHDVVSQVWRARWSDLDRIHLFDEASSDVSSFQTHIWEAVC